MAIQKIKSGRVTQVQADEWVGPSGTIFYNEDLGDLRVGDGVTPGGIPLSFGGGGGGGNYTLPTATTAVKGGVKIDGTTIAIANQVISVGTVPYSSLSGTPTIPTNTNQLTNGAGYITSGALSGYATESYVTGRGYITSSALTGLASESYVTSRGYITSSALSSYATQSYVTSQGYITSSALSGYALTSAIPTNNSQLTNGAGYITNSALTSYATQSYVTSRGYLTSVSWDQITNKPNLAGTYSFGIAGDDSTIVEIASGNTVQFKGGTNITVTTNANGVVTITGPNLSSYATQSYVTGLGYITGAALSGYALTTAIPTDISQLSDTQGLLGQGGGGTVIKNVENPFSFSVAGDDSTLREIANGESIKFSGAGGITVTTDSEGNITITGSASTTAVISATAPDLDNGAIWYNSTDGRTYVKYNDVWVDANPPVVPEVSTYLDGLVVNGTTITTVSYSDTDISINDLTFTANGVIQLPEGGDIVDSLGHSVLGGVTSYNDLTDKPTLFSGNYSDLNGLPALFDGNYNHLTNLPTLFSGSWNDLTDKPNIAGTYSFNVAADDSTLREINSDETIKFVGAGGITTSSDDEGKITITQGTTSSLVNGDFNFILGPDGTVNFDPSGANGKGVLQTTADLQFIAVDKAWTFGTNGVLTLPNGSTIGDGESGAGVPITTARGTILLGNLAECAGGESHFHIMKAGQQAIDLFLGDDNNYVKLPNTGGVEISSSEIGNQHYWTFGTDGSITFPDATVQTTAWTGVFSYNNLTDKPNLAGTYTWSIAADDSTQLEIGTGNLIKIQGAGGVTTALDADGNVTITGAAGIVVSATAPADTLVKQWYNSTDGRTYVKYNDLWVDANPPVVPEVSTYLDGLVVEGTTITTVSYDDTDIKIHDLIFGADGVIHLPIDGDIVDSNGNSVLGGGSVDLTGYATEVFVTSQGYITSSALTGYALTSAIPTNNNQLTNGSGYITSAALTGLATESYVTSRGYITGLSWNQLTDKPNLASTYSFNVAADDSTLREISADETVKFTGAGGITTSSDAEGAITITGPDLSSYVTLTGEQTLTNKTLTSPTITDGVFQDTFTIGNQVFYEHGYNGFSVNEDFDIVGENNFTGYHYTSGAGREGVAFTLARTGQFTTGFGIHGTAENNEYVIGSETTNTDFVFKNNIGMPFDVSGGTEIFRISKTGVLTTGSGESLETIATQSYVTTQGYITSTALTGLATESFVTSRGYITGLSWDQLTNKPNLAGTYSWSIAADDSTQLEISAGNLVKVVGARGVTTSSNADGQITITGPDLSSYATQSYVNAAIAAAGVTISETAPTGLLNGALWYNSSSLELYVRYNNAWVAASSSGGGGTSDYNDLTNKPTNVSQFTNDAGYVSRDEVYAMILELGSTNF